jgi:hypothetical protein
MTKNSEDSRRLKPQQRSEPCLKPGASRLFLGDTLTPNISTAKTVKMFLIPETLDFMASEFSPQ